MENDLIELYHPYEHLHYRQEMSNFKGEATRLARFCDSPEVLHPLFLPSAKPSGLRAVGK